MSRTRRISALTLCLLLASSAYAAPERTVSERAQHFARGARVHAKVKRQVRNKPIVPVTNANAREYLRAMAPDTVEIIFKPDAHPEFGHLLVRVGDRLFDHGNVGMIRNRDAAGSLGNPWGTQYGFVFKLDAQRVERLKQRYIEKVRTNGPFDPYGRTGDSCATFVTGPLAEIAADLGIRHTAGAIDAAAGSMRNAKLEAVSIYARDHRGLEDGTMKFKKLTD